jgi:protein phosphatase PTC7
LIVVADGVGGWGEVGIDPGLFSKALVKFIEEEYLKNPNGTLKNYLIEAVKRNKHTGSSTCVLAKFDKVRENNKVYLKTCNLGDSGYMLIRAPKPGSNI